MGKGKNKSLRLGVIEKVVSIPQGEGQDPFLIYVRGLSPADISVLMFDDVSEDMKRLYRELVTTAVTPQDIEEKGMALLSQMPKLMAKTIALAGDVPDQWEDVMDWAIGAQVEVLQAVAVLTFTSESVAKKLREVVAKWLADGPPDLLKNSQAGSGA